MNNELEIKVEKCGTKCPFFSCYELGTCYDCGCNHPNASNILVDSHSLDDICNDESGFELFPEECPLKEESVRILIG